MRCANPAVLDFQRFPSCGIIGTLHAVAVVRGGTIGSEQAVQCEIESQNLRLAEEKAIDGRSTCVINFAHVALTARREHSGKKCTDEESRRVFARSELNALTRVARGLFQDEWHVKLFFGSSASPIYWHKKLPTGGSRRQIGRRSELVLLPAGRAAIRSAPQWRGGWR
jgi:hypothetical protein